MTRAIRGILVECDPSIKSIILKIDALASSGHKFVVDDLDDQTLVINADMLGLLKQELDRVCSSVLNLHLSN
ncbi:uncharacterized protein RCO7_01075 [Rhynchosporium graminicola]|uniref:General transcription and DNA repair factor IIH subunit TFB5 n=1 Tax=Rhynchosporium graminicola TaxID=2792576 RepID=A0A1E1JQK5_9HELO|nr:uncharacterized protein RCO7_01075 [Rhynchosporium commune]